MKNRKEKQRLCNEVQENLFDEYENEKETVETEYNRWKTRISGEKQDLIGGNTRKRYNQARTSMNREEHT